MKRALSRRPSKPAKRFCMADVYIEGHGEIDPWVPTFTVPDSVDIVIYQGIGLGLDDEHGQAIVNGEGVPATLPTQWDGSNQEYDTDPQGKQRRGTGHRRIYREGEQCPDYKLFPFNHPNMADLTGSVKDSSYKLSYKPALGLGYYERLSEIARRSTHQNRTLHWACCTVVR
jgi:hypothetical protein